jgi:hypothetical protein
MAIHLSCLVVFDVTVPEGGYDKNNPENQQQCADCTIKHDNNAKPSETC